MVPGNFEPSDQRLRNYSKIEQGSVDQVTVVEIHLAEVDSPQRFVVGRDFVDFQDTLHKIALEPGGLTCSGHMEVAEFAEFAELVGTVFVVGTKLVDMADTHRIAQAGTVHTAGMDL